MDCSYQNKKLTGIQGTPAQIFHQLIGKTVCHASQVGQFKCNYLMKINSVTFDNNTYTLNFTMIQDYKPDFNTTHTCGKSVVCLYWIVEETV